jgi:hypothetical protein
MIAGYKQLILRAHSRGIKIIGGTLLPWENETFAADAYTPEGAAKQQAINAWIRPSGAFDGVVDFDKLLQDPAHPNRMLLKWDSGDHLHPRSGGDARRFQPDGTDAAGGRVRPAAKRRPCRGARHRGR